MKHIHIHILFIQDKGKKGKEEMKGGREGEQCKKTAHLLLLLLSTLQIPRDPFTGKPLQH